MYNEGELYLYVKAGSKVGRKVTVKRAPTDRYPPLRIEAVTRDSAIAADTVRREPLSVAYDSIGHTVVVSGTMRLGDSTRVTIAYRHPGDASGVRRSKTLRAAQDRRAGRGRGAPADAPSRHAHHHRKRAVCRCVAAHAEAFAEPDRRTAVPYIGYVTSGDGSLDSARAVGARTLAEWGITTQDAAYRDGSGLSRHEYLTPRAVVRVLDAMHRSPWYDLFRNALPLAGVDGTIGNRMKGTPAQGNAHAKTGTLDKARSLSGYVTSSDGRLLFFSLLCNNFSVPTREVERVQDLLVSTMAGGTFPELR